MKIARIIIILLSLILIYSCSKEKSTLSGYRDLVQELKNNSSNYNEEEWEEVTKKYENLEEKVKQCKFSPKEKKELNKMRGQCVAYKIKAITKQTKHKMEDVFEQFSDMAEGFNEALSEDDDLSFDEYDE